MNRENMSGLDEIIEYFAGKDPSQIQFSDADIYDYKIYQIYQEWQKQYPDKDFKKTFPHIDELWELLAEWRAEDEDNEDRCKKIVSVARKYSNHNIEKH